MSGSVRFENCCIVQFTHIFYSQTLKTQQNILLYLALQKKIVNRQEVHSSREWKNQFHGLLIWSQKSEVKQVAFFFREVKIKNTFLQRDGPTKTSRQNEAKNLLLWEKYYNFAWVFFNFLTLKSICQTLKDFYTHLCIYWRWETVWRPFKKNIKWFFFWRNFLTQNFQSSFQRVFGSWAK